MNVALNQQTTMFPETEDRLWQSVLSKDVRSDGQFVFAVSSTGIYCRPSCPSRRPRRENVSFFSLPEAAERAGYRACRRCHPQQAQVVDPRIEMTQRVCRLIDENEGGPITLAALGELVGISPFHLQRTFKAVMGISPSQYSENSRVEKFKSSVRKGGAVTAAIYDAGYGSSSRLYEGAASQLGMTPATYGKAGKGASINFAIVECSFGKLLVAATPTGVCSVKLGDSDAQLESELRSEFSAAEIHRDEETLASAARAIVDHLSGKTPHINLPLDIRATAFQMQVWNQLRAIPAGQTLSYSEVAAAIGQSKSVRAVARACATNPVALVIPCHRVIREDRTLGGYRWGLDRKRRLLQEEKDLAK
jgi:AraC family transcriptional regulator of adaptative response/methylated-DNA-[protein]-cysteine methyltransferase